MASGIRTTPVLSAELQRLWIDRPSILFVGTLNDISRLPDGTFQLTLTHDGFISSKLLIMMSSFGLRVKCPETTGNALLAAHGREPIGLFSGVAVVARIDTVTQEMNGERVKRVGVGKCLEAVYLGTERIWKNSEH